MRDVPSWLDPLSLASMRERPFAGMNFDIGPGCSSAANLDAHFERG
jgi:hypothetical protein